MLTWLLNQHVRAVADYRKVLIAYLIGNYVCFATVFVNYWNGSIWGDGRFTGEGFNPNDLAATLALAVPVAAYLATTNSRERSGRKLTMLLAVSYILLSAFGVMLTASRSGVLVFGGSCVTFIVLAI